MFRRLVRLIFLSVVFCLVAEPAAAQSAASLTVRVVDAQTQQPIAGAHVTFPDLYLFWITDSSGIATASPLPVGRHVIEITVDGYATSRTLVEFEAGAMAEADIDLAREIATPAAAQAIVMKSSGVSNGQDASIRLNVYDEQTMRPLDGAQVTFTDLFRYWITNEDGIASVTAIPAGQHEVEVAIIGYLPVRAKLNFRPGAIAEADVRMTAQPVQIEGIDVTVHSDAPDSDRLVRTGFYERYGRVLGQQLNRVDISRKNPSLPSDVFRTMPGIRLVPNDQGKIQLINTRRFIAVDNVVSPSNVAGDATTGGPRSGQLDSSAGCRMNYYLDGIPWEGDIDSLLLDWVEGIEVYSGSAAIPAQYARTDTGCGVVLIWTR